ncbi:MAG: hypothetical protein JXA54_04815 [Candidatus Heimdallarchaeota archaeon]|nr:hypothetical protein [Candidatus Heimdallarchaeota archaeon]
MSQTNKLFHVCHVMFSNGITKPEAARELAELESIINQTEDYNVAEILQELIEQGYIGKFEEKFFLLGKGIIAVAAIFT